MAWIDVEAKAGFKRVELHVSFTHNGIVPQVGSEIHTDHMYPYVTLDLYEDNLTKLIDTLLAARQLSGMNPSLKVRVN